MCVCVCVCVCVCGSGDATTCLTSSIIRTRERGGDPPSTSYAEPTDRTDRRRPTAQERTRTEQIQRRTSEEDIRRMNERMRLRTRKNEDNGASRGKDVCCVLYCTVLAPYEVLVLCTVQHTPCARPRARLALRVSTRDATRARQSTRCLLTVF